MSLMKNLTPLTYEELQVGMHKRFEEVVALMGDHPAVYFSEGSLSYIELNHRANQLAYHLQTKTDQRYVITWMNGETHSVIAMLALMKLGRIWIPVSSRLPAASALKYFEKFEDPLILSDHTLPDELDNIAIPVIRVDEITFESDVSLADPIINHTDIVSIMSTSGSTGVPKAIPQTQEAQLTSFWYGSHIYDTKPGEHIMLLGEATFIFNVSVLQASLLLGSTIHTVNFQRYTLDDIHRRMKNYNITAFTCIPSAFRMIFADVKPGDFPALRTIRVGGEALLASDLQLLKRNFPPSTRFCNLIGSTEVGYIAHFFAGHDTELTTETIPVGKSSEFRKIVVVNDANEPVINEVGSIIVYGKGFSPYWNDPQLSAEKFSPDPEREDWMIFHTGDMGIMLPDGNLIHMGRKDFEIKIRGFRVDIIAIESCMSEHPAVARVVVHPYQVKQENRLAAYIVPAEGAVLPNDNVWRSFIMQTLPDYMVPTHFIKLDALPLLPNGKVDRKQLPDPITIKIRKDRPLIAPRTATEKQLLAIWNDILDVNDAISVQDSFFDLGGNSLQATALISDVNEIFNVMLTPAMLFQYPTIAELAQLIGTGEVNQRMHPAIIPFRPYGIHYPIFCLPGSLGNGLSFQMLAQYMGEHYPVYGLQMRGVDGKEPLPESLDDLLDYYIEAVRSLRLRIPIYLLGASVGGVHAYEMACRLKDSDIQVECVIMLDTFFTMGKDAKEKAFMEEVEADAQLIRNIQQKRIERQKQRRLKRRAYEWLSFQQQKLQRVSRWPVKAARLLLMAGSEREAWLANRQHNELRVQQMHQRIRPIEERVHTDIMVLTEDIRQTSHRIMEGYMPRPYEGNLIYLKALLNDSEEEHPRDEQWRALVKGNFQMELFNAPHTLANMPHVEKVADYLKSGIIL